MVASAVVFLCLSSHMIRLSAMNGETPSSMSCETNLPLVVLSVSSGEVSLPSTVTSSSTLS